MTPSQAPDAPAAEQQTPADLAALERELLAYAATWEQRQAGSEAA
jgi:hypothetical protein